jgi:LemA protein
MGVLGWIIIAAIVLLLLSAIALYNRLVRLRALVKEGFSGITVQLRRRADLIPNLVESVQGYATHEREVFEEVSANRSKALSAGSVQGTAQADAQMTGLLGRLFAVAEAYPELKANQNFLQLQNQLDDLENKIAAARRFYNNAAQEYNSKRESVPATFFAQSFGFGPQDFFDLGPEERSRGAVPPQVKFQ